MQVQQAMRNKLRNTILDNWKRYYDADNITLQRNRMKGIAPNTPIEAGLYQLNKQIGEMEEIIRTALPNENAEQARSRQKQAVQRLFNILETKHNELTKSGILDEDKHKLGKLLDRFPELKTFVRNNIESKLLNDIKSNPNISDDLKQDAENRILDSRGKTTQEALELVKLSLEDLNEDIEGKDIPEKELKLIKDISRDINSKKSINQSEETAYLSRISRLREMLGRKGIETRNTTPQIEDLKNKKDSSTKRSLLPEFEEENKKQEFMTNLELLVDDVKGLNSDFEKKSGGETPPPHAKTLLNNIRTDLVELGKKQGASQEEMQNLVSKIFEYKAVLENTLERLASNPNSNIATANASTGATMEEVNDGDNDDNQQRPTSYIPSHKNVRIDDDNFQSVPVESVLSVETKKKLDILNSYINANSKTGNPDTENINRAKAFIKGFVDNSTGKSGTKTTTRKKLDEEYKEFVQKVVSPFKAKLTKEEKKNEKKTGEGKAKGKKKVAKKRKSSVSKKKGKGKAVTGNSVSFIPEGISNF